MRDSSGRINPACVELCRSQLEAHWKTPVTQSPQTFTLGERHEAPLLPFSVVAKPARWVYMRITKSAHRLASSGAPWVLLAAFCVYIKWGGKSIMVAKNQVVALNRLYQRLNFEGETEQALGVAKAASLLGVMIEERDESMQECAERLRFEHEVESGMTRWSLPF